MINKHSSRLFSLFLFIINTFCYAENKLLPANNDSIQFNQKQRLKSEFDQRHQLKNQNSITSNTESIQSTINEACFPIERIHLLGVTALTPNTQKQLTLPYLSQCLTLSEIQNVTKFITNYYIEQGYITSHAFIPEQNLSHRELIIQVIEGRIETIEIESSPSRLTGMVFPGQIGNRLNLRDIEQGLEQLNRSASTKYAIDIQPGENNGYSRLVIHKSESKWPLSGQLNLDNSGTKSTGKQLVTGNLIADSLFGLGEQWTLSANTDTDITHSHHSRYYIASLNLPYGYWSYRYQFYQNTSLQPFETTSDKYNYESKNTNQQFDINRLIYRDGKQRFILQSSLKHKKALTKIAKQKLDISSPTLTTLNFNPQYSIALGQGYLTLNPVIEFGLSTFGASSDYIEICSPRSHYRKFSLNSSYQYYFSEDLTYLTSFYAQYSPDNLYNVERINIGGQYSVRGYQEQSLNGNNGFYWRNEISKGLINSKIGQPSLIGAIDYGYISGDKHHVENDMLIGGAVGLSVNENTNFSSQLLVSNPLLYPSILNPEKLVLYWSIYFSL